MAGWLEFHGNPPNDNQGSDRVEDLIYLGGEVVISIVLDVDITSLPIGNIRILNWILN